MKLINEKGKLFGLVNLVDLLVVLMVVAICAVLATKFMGDRATEMVSAKEDYWFEVEIVGANPRYYNEIDRIDPKGVGLIAGNSFQDATIEDYWYEEFTMSTTDAEGNLHWAKDDVRKNIVYLIKGKAAKNSPTPMVANQEVRVGRTFTVKTLTTEINGIIRYAQFGEYTGTGSGK